MLKLWELCADYGLLKVSISWVSDGGMANALSNGIDVLADTH